MPWRLRFILPKIITATTLMAAVVFLWYRRGRLWSFYYSVISQSLPQIKSDSLNRSAWENIAFENLELLVKNLFPSLFEFEIEYLRNKITDNQYLLWISDSSTTVEKATDNRSNTKWVQKEIVITDKEKYCLYSLKKIFFNEFSFCGLGLFLNSFIYRFRKKKTDPGYTERLS